MALKSLIIALGVALALFAAGATSLAQDDPTPPAQTPDEAPETDGEEPDEPDRVTDRDDKAEDDKDDEDGEGEENDGDDEDQPRRIDLPDLPNRWLQTEGLNTSALKGKVVMVFFIGHQGDHMTRKVNEAERILKLHRGKPLKEIKSWTTCG